MQTNIKKQATSKQTKPTLLKTKSVELSFPSQFPTDHDQIWFSVEAVH